MRAVIAQAGMDGFNRVWLAPEHLPTLDEIGRPCRLGRTRRRVRGMASRRPPAVARVLERVTATVREHGLLHARRDRARLRLGRSRLRLPARVAGAAPAAVPDAARGLPLRPPAATRLVGRRGVRAPARRAASPPVPPAHRGGRARRPAPRSRHGRPPGARAPRTRSGARSGRRSIAEGHTLDDQAETVLLNLLRGTGLDGLAGIWPGEGDRPGSSVVQPLLDVTRAESRRSAGRSACDPGATR